MKKRPRERVAMRVTAIRVSEDLWRLLEAEAAGVGVSVSQYLREAALARASAAAAARGEDPFDLLAPVAEGAHQLPAKGANARDKRALEAQLAAHDVRRDAQAIRAESEQARKQARRQRAARR
jgi:hypothetical protein